MNLLPANLQISTIKSREEMEKEIRDECWKELCLPDFNNGVSYHISNYGRIKSFAYCAEGKILKGGLVQGYRSVSFAEYKGKRITKYIHKLVAEHFVIRENEKQEYVIHLDFDKTNNVSRNLRWASKEEKEEHQNKNPLFVASKSQVKNSKLTEAQVVLIKMALKRNRNRLKIIARRFGITHTQLNRIRNGENWGYVKVE